MKSNTVIGPSPEPDGKGLVAKAAMVFAAGIAESALKPQKLTGLTRDRERCIRHQPSQIKTWSDREGGAKSGPLYRAAVILQVTGNSLPLQWLCGQLGGVFVPSPRHYGKSTSKKLPTEILSHPELGEWLHRSHRITSLRRALYLGMMQKATPSKEEFFELLVAWMDLKGWIEGYLSWVGHTGSELQSPGDPTPASAAIPAWCVLKQVFGTIHKNAKPFTKTIAESLDVID